MGNLILGFQAMLRVWSDGLFAGQVRKLLDGAPLAEPAPIPPAPAPATAPAPPPPRRSEALSLLAVLQREARFVDFIQEPIAGYTDAQVGAAVRGIHQDSAAVLARLFELQPLRSENEGASLEVPAGFDSAKFRLTGNVLGSGPWRGTLAHPGWVAGKCELPEWTGSDAAALVVAPAEVEVG